MRGGEVFLRPPARHKAIFLLATASDAVLLRATGLEYDLDGSGIAPIYPPSSADGSGSTEYDEAHRSGHVFPNYAVPLDGQSSDAEPAAIQQRTYDNVDEESFEDEECDESSRSCAEKSTTTTDGDGDF